MTAPGRAEYTESKICQRKMADSNIDVCVSCLLKFMDLKGHLTLMKIMFSSASGFPRAMLKFLQLSVSAALLT